MTDDEGRAITATGLPPRARQVLGVLTAHYDRLQSKDSLADAIWGDRPPDKYGAALEHYISVLRRRLEPGRPRAESFIVTRAGGYLFTTERAALDLAELHHLVKLADASPPGAPGRIALRRRVIEFAATLPFAEDEYASWAARPRAEVRDAMLAAHVEVGSAVECDDPEEALRLARRAIDLDRYTERPYQIAMRAAAALGRPDEALRWFERCSQRLREELGVGPSAETGQLRDRIAADRATVWPALAVVGPASARRPERASNPDAAREAPGLPGRPRWSAAAQPRAAVEPTGGADPVASAPPVGTSAGGTLAGGTPVGGTSVGGTLAGGTLAVALPPGRPGGTSAPAATPLRRARRDPRRSSDDLLRHLAGRRATSAAPAHGHAAQPGQQPQPDDATPLGPAAGWNAPGDWHPRSGGALEFIGRREEIELVLTTAPVPLVHIVGPAGAGKSALLAELRRRAPGRVAVGAAVGPGELRLSWLHAMLAQLGVAGVAGAPVDRAVATGRPLTRDELAAVVAAVDSRGPVVLGIDDAAELDPQSVAELNWIGRHSRAIGLALTLPCTAQPAGLPVGRLGGAVVLHLRRLTEPEFRGGGDPDAAERSGGIPALLGALRQPRSVAMATAAQLVARRTHGLPAAAGRILRACAALGSLRVDQIATVIELPLTEVLHCTDQLVHAELVDEGPGGHIRHSSALVRAALAEQVSSAHTIHLRRRLKADSA